MRVVIQRVKEARVTVGGELKAAIGRGLLLLTGVEAGEGEEAVEWVSGKVVRMRLFADEAGKMNRSLVEMGGELLVVSQFTLLASVAGGNRPSYSRAAAPETARQVYEALIRQLEKDLGRRVGRGEFGATMEVSLVNDGPVTIVIDSQRRE
jgi:D-aminoacyl-tRNA deacylase